MDYFWAAIGLLAGLGAFLFGFKALSENVEKLANNKLRRWFDKTANNKWVGVGIGTVTTAILQSSSATTVMVVGFVNAGLMSLYQATAVIMGANVGTTITAQIAALQAFDFIGFITVFTGVGVLLDMLSKNHKAKTVGVLLAGLGLVFLGLQVMSDSMSIFRGNAAFRNLLSKVSNPFLLLLIGALFTALVQSSSAVTSLVIIMVGSGLSIGAPESNGVLFLILGSNIGTCATAMLSSVGAGTNAKRAALIHLLFNVVGCAVFTVFLLCFPSFMRNVLAKWFPEPQTQIAMFHTMFNAICVLLFLPFTSVFVKIATGLVREKVSPAQSTRFLDERILQTPAVALNQVSRQAESLLQSAMQSLELAFCGFIQADGSYRAREDERNEEIFSAQNEITEYLIRISARDISYEDEKIVSALHHGVVDIARIAELAENITRYTEIVRQNEIFFSDGVRGELRDMHEKVQDLYKILPHSFVQGDLPSRNRIDALEEEIDEARRALVNDHIRRLNEGKCKPASSSVFISLVGNLERAADHLTNLAHLFEETVSV